MREMGGWGDGGSGGSVVWGDRGTPWRQGGQGEDTSVRGFPPVKERVRGQGGVGSGGQGEWGQLITNH
jgi:hypothetical protein